MLKQTPNDGNHFHVVGVAFNARHDAGNAAHQQRALHAGLGSLGDLVDDALVGNGVGLEHQAVGLALLRQLYLLVDLVQDHRLYLQRRNRKLLVAVGSVLQAHVAEEHRGILADGLVGGDEAEVGVELRGFLVVVAGAQLRDVLHALVGVARDGADLGMHLEVVEAVDNVGAGLLEALAPFDVVRLIEAGAQLEQRGNLFAVLCGGNQGFCQVRLACKAIERDLDAEHRGVVCGLVEHLHERVHALVRVHQQHIALAYLLDDGTLLVEHGRPLRGERLVGDLARNLGIHHAGKAPSVAHIQRHAGYEALVRLQVQALQQELLGNAGKRGVGLQTHRSQAGALLQHALHVLAVVVVQVFLGAVVRVDVGVARYADNAGALGGVHVEHLVDDGLDGVLQQDELRALAGELDNAAGLMGQGDKAERGVVCADVLLLLLTVLDLGVLLGFGLFAVGFLVQAQQNVELAVLQVGERVARVDDLRRKVGHYALAQVSVQVGRLVLGKVFRLQLMDVVVCQLTQDLLVDTLLLGIQVVATLVDRKQLLVGRHLRLVLAHVLVDQGKVGQAAHAYHEELLQVAGEDGHEGKALKHGDVAVFALIEHALVEGQPRKLTVLHVGQHVAFASALLRQLGGCGAGRSVFLCFH